MKKMSDIEYTVKTNINDKCIHQQVSCIMEETIQKISEKVVDTECRQFREALIKLGWTPPPKEKK